MRQPWRPVRSASPFQWAAFAVAAWATISRRRSRFTGLTRCSSKPAAIDVTRSRARP